MPVTNIITPTEVKTYSSASSEFDVSNIKDWMIRNAQDNHLKSLLGQDLYYDVLLNPSSYASLIAGCDYTYSGYNRNYKGLKYYMAAMVLYEAAPFFWTSLSNAGFHHKNVETATNATGDEVTALKNFYFNQAQKEGDLIRQYINDNISSYPLYSDGQPGRIIGGIYFSNEFNNESELINRMRHPIKGPRD